MNSPHNVEQDVYHRIESHGILLHTKNSHSDLNLTLQFLLHGGVGRGTVLRKYLLSYLLVMLPLCRSYGILMCDHPIKGHFGKPKVKLNNQQTTSLTSKKLHQSRGCISPYSTLMPNCDRYFW